MGKDDYILGNNDIDDVRWLCSLSESELDFLISLKMLVIQRAENRGDKALFKKFDLRILRALGFILMEFFKEQLKEKEVIPGLTDSPGFLDGCNLLKQELDDSFSSKSVQDLKAFISSDRRKRIAEMFLDNMAPNQKQKTETESSL